MNGIDEIYIKIGIRKEYRWENLNLKANSSNMKLAWEKFYI